MAYEAHTNLLIELFRYSIEYMKLWVPLFIIYHLVKKYKDKILSGLTIYYQNRAVKL